MTARINSCGNSASVGNRLTDTPFASDSHLCSVKTVLIECIVTCRDSTINENGEGFKLDRIQHLSAWSWTWRLIRPTQIVWPLGQQCILLQVGNNENNPFGGIAIPHLLESESPVYS